MGTSELNQFRAFFSKLLHEQLAEERTYLQESIPENGGDEMDRQVEDRNNVLRLKLDGRKNFYCKKIKEAMRKINQGTFGLCDECGGEIEHARLLARPTATLCIGCKEEEERTENHIPYNRRSHTLGKGFDNSNILASNRDGVNPENGDGEDLIKEKILNFNKSKIKMESVVNL